MCVLFFWVAQKKRCWYVLSKWDTQTKQIYIHSKSMCEIKWMQVPSWDKRIWLKHVKKHFFQFPVSFQLIRSCTLATICKGCPEPIFCLLRIINRHHSWQLLAYIALKWYTPAPCGDCWQGGLSIFQKKDTILLSFVDPACAIQPVPIVPWWQQQEAQHQPPLNRTDSNCKLAVTINSMHRTSIIF